MADYKKTSDGDLVFNDGACGWGDEKLSDDQKLYNEEKIVDEAQHDYPRAWAHRPAVALPESLKGKLETIHQKHNMSMNEGSIDLRLISELCFGEIFKFPRQIIGSCVASGGMRAWTFASMWQLVANGEPEELLGHQRLSVDTVAPYGPFSYGCGRRRGNLRRGDGSWCGVQVESYQKDGVIDCNTPQLHRITGTTTKNFPEPQSSSLYRSFGSWKYLDDLLPYADYKLNEAVKVRNADQCAKLLAEYKPMLICSSWGFAPGRSGKVNGYTVYRRSGSWAHNLSVVGVLIAPNGDRYFIILNSWGPTAHRDGEIFVVTDSTMNSWLKSASCIAVGDIDLPDSVPSIF